MVPEGRRLFGSLSVEENLQVGATYARPGPWTIERVYELFDWMRGAPQPAHRPAVRRRAADGRHRPGAGRQPAGAAARRAVARPGAGGRAAHLRHAAADPGDRPHRAAGRAGREPGAAGGLAHPLPAGRPDHAGRQARRRHRGAGRGGLLRPGWRCHRPDQRKGASRYGLGERHHPGRADRRAVRAVRLRAVADVRGHEGGEPRPRRPGCGRRRTSRSASSPSPTSPCSGRSSSWCR